MTWAFVVNTSSRFAAQAVPRLYARGGSARPVQTVLADKRGDRRRQQGLPIPAGGEAVAHLRGRFWAQGPHRQLGEAAAGGLVQTGWFGAARFQFRGNRWRLLAQPCLFCGRAWALDRQHMGEFENAPPVVPAV